MPHENIKSIVDFALVDDAAKMRSALYDTINDKIYSALEQRKIEIASNLLNVQQQDNVEDNTEVETAEQE